MRSAAASPLDRLGLREDVPVTPLGVWWTYDAPSLSVPRGHQPRVKVWCTGDGPSLACVPAPGGSHESWERIAPALGQHFTLHAVDRPSSSAEPLTVAAADADFVAAVLASVGAPFLLGSVRDAAALCRGAEAWGATAVCLFASPGEQLEVGDVDLPGRVDVLEVPENWPHTSADRLVEELCAVFDTRLGAR